MYRLTPTLSEMINTSSTNRKEEILVNFLKNNEKELNEVFITFIANEITPISEKLNVGPSLMMEAISKISGHNIKDIKAKKIELGTVSETFSHYMKHKKQQSLFKSEPISASSLLIQLRKLPYLDSNSEKIHTLKICFANQTPLSASFISNFILNDLPMGCGIPTILSAISKFKNRDVEEAYNFVNSAVVILSDVNLNLIDLQPFCSIKPQRATSTTIFSGDFDESCIMEPKLDGGRLFSHISHDRIELYSSNLENLTNSFPDLIEHLKEVQKLNSEKLPIILDSELVVNNKFTDFLKRVKRKYDITPSFIKQYPATAHVFDIIYCKHPIYSLRLSERKKILEDITIPSSIKKVPYKSFISLDDMSTQYEKYLSEGYEGLMIKKDTPYEIGKRSKSWGKIKPTTTVDLVISKFEYGSGKNASRYSSFEVSTLEGESMGHVGTGFSEEILKKLTILLNSSSKPIILEIEFDSLQSSPSSSSGYSMRFPRLVQIREDKDILSLTPLTEILENSAKS